ncbi:hypothetical protein CCR85_11740 [Rhodothalassium salexigens]|nr:hypothetical protein [Rhodothalassium salexigens]
MAILRAPPFSPAAPALPDNARDLLSFAGSTVDAVMISVPDAQGRFHIAYANPAFERLFGWTSEELAGQSPDLLYDLGVHPGAVDRIQARLDRNSPVHERMVNKRKDGSTLWVDLTVTPITDDTGRCSHAVSIRRDVTHEVEADRDRQAYRDRFNRFIATVNGVAFVWRQPPDSPGHFQWVSPKAERLLGVDGDTLLSTPTALGLDPVDAERWLRTLNEAGRNLTPWRFEGRRSGSAVAKWVFASAEPRREPDGSASLAGILFDVTDEREQLAVHKSLLESTRAIYWEMADSSCLRFSYVSPQAEALLGYPLDAWYDENFWAGILHPDDRDWAVAFCQRAAAGREDHEFEYRVVTRDGRVLWLRDVVSVTDRADGFLLQGFMFDVTGDHQRREELARKGQLLAQRETRYRTLFEAMPDGLLLVDADDTIREANSAFEPLLGYPPTVLIGRPLADLLVEDEGEPADPSGGTMAESRPLLARRDDGTTRPVTVVRRALSIDGTEGAVVVIRDRQALEAKNAALVEMSRRLQREARRAEEASQAKSQFMATMSHEFRTPLNAIIGFADLMHEGVHGPVDNPRYAENIAIIRDQGRHLLSIINNVIDAAKLTRGLTPEMTLEPVDLRALVATALQTAEVQDNGRHRFVNALDADAAWVRGDRRALRQILDNLVTNACKYTPPQATVRVTSERRNDAIALVISDNGPGIPAHMVSKLTEPFWRADDVMHAAQEGAGLGLTICDGLCTAMGARMTIRSEQGQGTEVTVHLLSADTTDPA